MNDLTEHGPRIPLELLSTDGRHYLRCHALLDTGADMTSIEDDAIQQLGYRPVGKVTIVTATGEEERNLYDVTLRLPEHEPPYRVELRVAGLGPFGDGPEPFVLLGRDLMALGKLHYNGKVGVFQLALGDQADQPIDCHVPSL